MAGGTGKTGKISRRSAARILKPLRRMKRSLCTEAPFHGNVPDFRVFRSIFRWNPELWPAYLTGYRAPRG